MSEVKLSLEEELPSPELFSDPEVDTNVSVAGTTDETSSTSAGCAEPDLACDDTDWKGISLEEIYKHHGPFDWNHLPPIHPTSNHTVLFELPLTNRGPPRAYPSSQSDKWSQNYVRMPHSVHSLYPIDPENESSGFRRRWEVIQEALLQSFMSSEQLQMAILSYNHKYAKRWNFSALHHFFNKYIDEEEMGLCLGSLIPKMIQLALQLPDLITGPLPLLKRQTNASISLSQLQVASLLANAFFCTFPRRNSSNPQSEYGTFPYINFNGLFSSFSEKRSSRCNSVMEKLKCLFHYFRRITSKSPEGTITIQRRYIARRNCPRWNDQKNKLPSLHISSKGTIETQGAGLLQVDFANKYVGGGVLNYGSVQEEIRFVICPELMVTMLVAEALEDTEALIIKGVERYSKYKGYSNTFIWDGDFIDETPRDSSGRLKTCIVAIDALQFDQPKVQFTMGNVIRELNKAYVGFSTEIASTNLPAVATGNWGCGAFRGNPQLKVLVQLMAAGVAGRSVVYFTFGDTSLRDRIADMYWHLVRNNVNIGHLFTLISKYQEVSVENRADFYRFLYNRTKMKSSVHFFNDKDFSSKSFEEEDGADKNRPDKWRFNMDFKKHASIAKQKEDALEEKIGKWLEHVESDVAALDEAEASTSKAEESVQIASTSGKETEAIAEKNDQPSTVSVQNKKKQTFDELFGEKKAMVHSPKKKVSALDTLDKLLIEEPSVKMDVKSVSMEVDVKIEKQEEISSFQNKLNSSKNQKESQKKISDFFIVKRKDEL
ncbi:poly(ADP-ribose) glycohydrolase [Trichogramma pretiosum]|uniref:poly(ADP-ribose) glycohydrolase n=1 Tax=Trichogramma pretiosum TaxID=7493 RepID=UPI0006C9A86A|nr:poly(ADP-ribose) glycohydrolase [Trichogramma pretiosum]